MAADRTVSLYTQPEPEELALGSAFKFHCHAGLACFNRCCRTPTIALSPYDIMRLKNFLGITSGELLRRYTQKVAEERSNLPLVFLDPYRSEEPGCPFLGPQGCTVYAQRPAACRLFPITMGSGLTEQGLADYYFCRRLDYCQGFETEVEWTVASWQDNQGFAEYDLGRREWLEILVRVGFAGTPITARLQDLVATAAYDLDAFRLRLLEPAFQQANGLTEPALEQLEANDLALLKFAYGYLQALLLPAEAEHQPGPRPHSAEANQEA